MGRPARADAAAAAARLAAQEEPVHIICSVRLSNGHFNSEVRVPLDADIEEKKRYADRWMELMLTCFKLGIVSADADFDKAI